MKVLIVSDTHGREQNLAEALEQTGPIDQLIHLGDGEGGADPGACRRRACRDHCRK